MVNKLALLGSLLTTACIAQGSAGFGMSGGSTTPPPTSEGGGGGGGTGGGVQSGPAPTAAEPRWDDFQFAVRERSGTYYGPWIMQKLTTFKVGAACYAKMGEKDSGPLNNSPYYTRNVVELAKKWTNNDWDQIEGQRNDHAKDRRLVEPMIDAFASQFHMTISVEGDDCETDRDAYWIRDWYTIGEAFAEYPPSSGKLTINLNVVAAARDITVDASGSVFTITAPRDFEAKDWTEKLAKPFRKNAKTL